MYMYILSFYSTNPLCDIMASSLVVCLKFLVCVNVWFTVPVSEAYAMFYFSVIVFVLSYYLMYYFIIIP